MAAVLAAEAVQCSLASGRHTKRCSASRAELQECVEVYLHNTPRLTVTVLSVMYFFAQPDRPGQHRSSKTCLFSEVTGFVSGS